MRRIVGGGSGYYHLAVLLCLGNHLVDGSTTSNEDQRYTDKVWIESERVFMKNERTNVTLKCLSDSPVHHCQFSGFYREGDAPTVPLVSLSSHAPPDTNATYWATDVPGVNYNLQFLRDDEEGCVLELVFDSFQDAVVGCRVAGDRWGEWRYAMTELNANERGLLPVDINARELVVLPGAEVTVACNASGATLENCRVATPTSVTTEDEWLDLDRGAASRDSRGRHRYHGAGVDRGECGVTVSNVTDEDAGVYRCLLTTDMARAQRSLKVIVAVPPSRPPSIRLDYLRTDADAVPTVKATCVHDHLVVPTPAVAWTLDDAPVTHDDADADDVTTSSHGEWAWPWTPDTPTRETVTVDTDEHEGRHLACYLSHVGLRRPLASPAIEITRDYPPTDAQLTLNYEKGITLKATCATDASRPVANITWLIGDRVVRRDAVNDEDDVGSVTQTLYVKLKPQDDARMLRCVATHPALVRPIEGAERVWYKPFDPLAMGMRDEVVVLPGGDVNISCMSPVDEQHMPDVETCSFKLFGRQRTAYFHAATTDRRVVAAGYRYHGVPVLYGGCGITLERVTEEDNGRILCRMESDTAILFMRYITVIVAHPPSAPVLRVRYVGQVIKASCSVAASRPMAEIAWMLGEDTIRQDSGDDSPTHSDADVDDGDGSYSHTHKSCRSASVKASVVQTIAWRLESEDNGRRLRCVVTHPSLEKPLEDVHEIVF